MSVNKFEIKNCTTVKFVSIHIDTGATSHVLKHIPFEV